MAKKATKNSQMRDADSNEKARSAVEHDPFAIAENRIQEAATKRSSHLDLSGLALPHVPSSISRCEDLVSIDLGYNRLHSLPDFLFDLELTSLILSTNRLTELPECIGKLDHLVHLSCASNLLKFVPSTLGKCHELTHLDLHQNDIKQFPSSLARLPNVRTFLIDENPLEIFPSWIGRLTSLSELGLRKCGLSYLPDVFTDLTSLKTLSFADNRITSLPSSLEYCTQLQTLDAAGNKLKSIPQYLSSLDKLECLLLHGNVELRIPQEILGPDFRLGRFPDTLPANPKDILNYFVGVRTESQSRPLNEVKLLMVGRGNAGKSSLRDRLVHNTFDEHKTETQGIDIQPWELHCHGEDMRIHVWDFAGQEITHSTHQFFLTERSVYVLVLEGRTDNQDRDAEYWLRIISTFGKNSPIIVALNQWDERSFDVDRNLLRDRYRSIVAFVSTDCKTGRGIQELKSKLCDMLRDLKEAHEDFPRNWWKIKEYFSAAKHNYLPFSDFRTLCENHGVNELKKQDSLARILHALGIILHYGEDARLRDTTVLNPQWVTNGVYRFLRLKDNQDSNGILSIYDAQESMPEEPLEMVRYLIELMRRFELCYPLDDGETRWLVPQVLTRYQPVLSQEWTTAPSTCLRYLYKVIPEGLLPRFIVRTHPFSEKSERWRNGVVLNMEGAKALIKAEHTDNRITVTVQGASDARLRLVILIRGHLQDIHSSLPGLDPKEEMEVVGHPNTYKDVATLEQDERRRLTTTVETPEGSVPIQQTIQLNAISAPLKRQINTPIVRVFVSYSQRDTRHLDVFKQNLKVMQMNGLITVWHDGLIRTGSEWDTEIRRELEEADVIIFMVSTNFLASDYIRGVEMARAIQRKDAGEAELLALILEPECGWKKPHELKPRGSKAILTCELGKYQAVYPTNKQAKRWPLAPHAFNHVEDSLEELRSQILSKRPPGGAVPHFRPTN